MGANRRAQDAGSLMKAPLHKACGTNHWSRQPCPAQKAWREDESQASKPAAPKPPVTADVPARARKPKKKSNPVAEEAVDRPKRDVEGQGRPVEASRPRREAKSGGARSQAAERTAPRHNRKPADPATAKVGPDASCEDVTRQSPGATLSAEERLERIKAQTRDRVRRHRANKPKP